MQKLKPHSDPVSRDLLSIAQQLRQVKDAEKQFLLRWAECTRRDPASSVTHVFKTTNNLTEDVSMDDLLLDALDHDWSNLYSGSVLDD